MLVTGWWYHTAFLGCCLFSLQKVASFDTSRRCACFWHLVAKAAVAYNTTSKPFLLVLRCLRGSQLVYKSGKNRLDLYRDHIHYLFVRKQVLWDFFFPHLRGGFLIVDCVAFWATYSVNGELMKLGFWQIYIMYLYKMILSFLDLWPLNLSSLNFQKNT